MEENMLRYRLSATLMILYAEPSGETARIIFTAIFTGGIGH